MEESKEDAPLFQSSADPVVCRHYADIFFYNRRQTMISRAILPLLCAIVAAFDFVPLKSGPVPCIGINDSGSAYILGSKAQNFTDYQTTAQGLSSLNPSLSAIPLNPPRSTAITGVCVSARQYLYVIGGDVVYPPMAPGVNGISIFDLSKGTWAQPNIFPASFELDLTSPRFMAATITSVGTNYVWLILFDATRAEFGRAGWYFYNIAQPYVAPTRVFTNTHAQVSTSFVAMVVQSKSLWLFSDSAIYQLDLQQLVANPNSLQDTNMTLNSANFTFQATDSWTPLSTTPLLPQGPGQAVAFGSKYIAFLAFNTTSITVFDTQTFHYTEPFPYPVTKISAAPVDFSNSTLVSLPFSNDSASGVILYNAGTSSLASFDLTNHWLVSPNQVNYNATRSPTTSGATTYPTQCSPGNNSCPLAPTPNSGLQPVEIIGCVLGGVSFVAMSLLACVCYMRYYKSNNKRRQNLQSMSYDSVAGATDEKDKITNSEVWSTDIPNINISSDTIYQDGPIRRPEEREYKPDERDYKPDESEPEHKPDEFSASHRVWVSATDGSSVLGRQHAVEIAENIEPAQADPLRPRRRGGP
ncbi:hypothetical protein BC938DRAFT_474508 [Jimgerdemannia flammicorona]|uniref:Uncharacterized protein n=1 Tax=Jimgerdemannia flammicorona TaxID=994334 RepID=A0A433QSG2_9FUNG|nr:hypothetical protein BC938DRAFT_474508 [Jimgerdemannia flammicorona]